MQRHEVENGAEIHRYKHQGRSPPCRHQGCKILPANFAIYSTLSGFFMTTASSLASSLMSALGWASSCGAASTRSKSADGSRRWHAPCGQIPPPPPPPASYAPQPPPSSAASGLPGHSQERGTRHRASMCGTKRRLQPRAGKSAQDREKQKYGSKGKSK